MKLNDIKTILKDQGDIKVFKEQISQEIVEYRTGLIKKADIIPIVLIEDAGLYLVKEDILLLCRWFLDNELSTWEIAYIVDGLLLSSRVVFESEMVLSSAEQLTDFQINGEVTNDTVNRIMRELA